MVDIDLSEGWDVQ